MMWINKWNEMCCVSIQCDNHFIKGVHGSPSSINKTEGPCQALRDSHELEIQVSALHSTSTTDDHILTSPLDASMLIIIHFQNITTRAGRERDNNLAEMNRLLRNKQTHPDTFGKHTAYSNMSLLENILGVVSRCAIIIGNKNKYYGWLILLLIWCSRLLNNFIQWHI